MLVFIDESGDPGFKVSEGSGSTPVFAAVMVIFAKLDEAERTQAIIKTGLRTYHKRPEFKFNKTSTEVKDKFFASISGCDFTIRAIVVRKEFIWSQALRSDDEAFYRFFIKSMMKFDNQVLRGAKVVIDGSGGRAFRLELQSYLKRYTADGAVDKVRLRDSQSEPLLQLADMCVGAIARSYRRDRDDATRWRQQIASKIDDVWEFK